MNHTPTPWKRYDSPLNSWIGNTTNGEIVCDRTEAGDARHWDGNAAFIIKACNAHDELVAALKDMTAILATIQNTLTGYLMPDSALDQDECINGILNITDHKNTLAKQRRALQALTKTEKGV